MIEIIETRPCNKVRVVKKLIQSAGNKIFGIWFTKKSSGKVRKMSCRARVFKPTYEKAPKGKDVLERKSRDAENNLVTLFDVNCIRRDSNNLINGRGSFKSIPMSNVKRIKVGGVIHYIKVV